MILEVFSNLNDSVIRLDVTSTTCQHCRTSVFIFTQNTVIFSLAYNILAYKPIISFEDKVKNWHVVSSTLHDINHSQFGMTGMES